MTTSCPTIAYRGNGFDSRLGNLLNSSTPIPVTWPEVIHAAITVGRGGWRDVFRHDRYSRYEMLYRASMIYANLRTRRGSITKTDAYHALDPSEKSAISYFLGLTFTKLLATKLLGIRWLLHLDVYGTHLGARYTNRGRPDLVGLDASGRWCVFEAKGRSNGLAPNVISTAKAQTEKLRTIDGHLPHLRVAAITYFSGRSLAVHMEDPDVFDARAGDLDVPEDQFLRDYYYPFTVLLEQVGEADRREVMVPMLPSVVDVAAFPVGGLRVGLERSIHYHILGTPGDYRYQIRDVAPSVPEPLARLDAERLPRRADDSDEMTDSRVGFGARAPTSSEYVFLGPDGVCVGLDGNWSAYRMESEPRDREILE